VPVLLASAATDTGLTGLSGFVVDVIAALGAVGVGFLTFLETVFPPIPSEVVLPLAGFLTQQGELNLAAVMVASTLGSLAGALVLYGAGAALGLERSARIADRIPLMDASDVHKAEAWFRRHGRAAIFFGRLVPGVRSLISLPAGTTRMPMGQFVLYTTLGSAIWNGLLVGGGVALGTQWHRLERYAGLISDGVLVVIVVVVLWLVAARLLQRRRASRDAVD